MMAWLHSYVHIDNYAIMGIGKWYQLVFLCFLDDSQAMSPGKDTCVLVGVGGEGVDVRRKYMVVGEKNPRAGLLSVGTYVPV